MRRGGARAHGPSRMRPSGSPPRTPSTSACRALIPPRRIYWIVVAHVHAYTVWRRTMRRVSAGRARTFGAAGAWLPEHTTLSRHGSGSACEPASYGSLDRRRTSSQRARATSDHPTSSSPSFATIWYSAIGSPRILSNQMSTRSSPETRNELASTIAPTASVDRVRPDASTATVHRKTAVAPTTPITTRPACDDGCAPS